MNDDYKKLFNKTRQFKILVTLLHLFSGALFILWSQHAARMEIGDSLFYGATACGLLWLADLLLERMLTLKSAEIWTFIRIQLEETLKDKKETL